MADISSLNNFLNNCFDSLGIMGNKQISTFLLSSLSPRHILAFSKEFKRVYMFIIHLFKLKI